MKTQPFPDWITEPFKLNDKHYYLYGSYTFGGLDTFKCVEENKYYTQPRHKWIERLKANNLIQHN